jgi:hypothetical protein
VVLIAARHSALGVTPVAVPAEERATMRSVQEQRIAARAMQVD